MTKTAAVDMPKILENKREGIYQLTRHRSNKQVISPLMNQILKPH